MDYTDYYTDCIEEYTNTCTKYHFIFGVQKRNGEEFFVAIVKKINPAPESQFMAFFPEVENDVEEFESKSFFETKTKYKDFLSKY